MNTSEEQKRNKLHNYVIVAQLTVININPLPAT